MAEDFDDINDMDDIDLDDLIGNEDVIQPQNVNNNQASQENRAVRKIKVKKLVKRPVSAPVEDSYNQPETDENSGEDDYAPIIGGDQPSNFDLDNYLDGVESNKNIKQEVPSNLPVVNNDHNQEEEQPRFIDESDLIDNKTRFAFLEGEPIPRKAVIIAAVVVFFVGFFFAKLFFAEQKIVQHGLQGVVTNPEVPKGRPRCGVAEKTQGCVLYIMNPERQELNARDFYDLASQLTKRQKFVIETGNMKYASVKIRPGAVVMLNIPPLQ